MPEYPEVTVYIERLEAMRAENHTAKRALTDPRILSGIGNAYSDEILHRAGMSPFKQTGAMSDRDLAALHRAAIDVLEEWTERLRADVGDGFPEKVTAFRPEMAVHGKYRQPCPVCGKAVQRIRYADNEANYCAQCQTPALTRSRRREAPLPPRGRLPPDRHGIPAPVWSG